MITCKNWVLVAMLVGCSNCAEISRHSDHLRQLRQLEIKPEDISTENPGEKSISNLEAVQADHTTTQATVIDDAMSTLNVEEAETTTQIYKGEGRSEDTSAREEDEDLVTTEAARQDTTAIITDVEQVTSARVEDEDHSTTEAARQDTATVAQDVEQETKVVAVTDAAQTHLALAEETTIKKQKAVIDQLHEVITVADKREEVDTIVTLHPRSTTTSKPTTVAEVKPTKLSAKLLEYLKNNKPKIRSRTSSTSTTEAPPPTTPSSPTKVNKTPGHKVYGARIVSRTPGADDIDDKIENSPRTSRARFFASGSSLLSGFVPIVPPTSREGRACAPTGAACKSPSVTEVHAAQPNINKQPTSSSGNEKRIAPVRRKPKPPAPLPPVAMATTTDLPISTSAKHDVLSRLSKRLRTTKETATTIPVKKTTARQATSTENVTNKPMFRKFKIPDIKSKLTSAVTSK